MLTKIKWVVFLLELIFMYVLGCWVGVNNTLKYQKPYTEDGNIIVVEVFGQEWVYEE